jgi:hypothetical protein
MPIWVRQALAAARKVPWRRVVAAIVWLATVGRQYWNRLTSDERRELFDLVKRSKGSRSNLSQAEQDRVVALLLKIRREPEGGSPAAP